MSRHDPAYLEPDESFLRRLAGDRDRLSGFGLALGSDAADGNEPYGEIETLAHKLAGAAGVYGFAAISAAALALEDRLRMSGAGREAQEMAVIEALIEKLVGEIEAALRP